MNLLSVGQRDAGRPPIADQNPRDRRGAADRPAACLERGAERKTGAPEPRDIVHAAEGAGAADFLEGGGSDVDVEALPADELGLEVDLNVEPVSEDNEKGKHTTTTARLLPLSGGGYVVDTPGVRQFQLWDVTAAEVAGFFRDVRPYVNLCHFPDCTHTHEDGCAVKDAVADGRLDERRYESYCHLFAGEFE